MCVCVPLSVYMGSMYVVDFYFYEHLEVWTQVVKKFLSILNVAV